ncbi:conserved hypothetical protein [Oleispira antarctica RB-8]|uniref:Uncharacterized protein n=1 Tax=Oleispira antarctica RB-8 TaxID=698738 RepID=R4YMW9_OLEAN|nr:conserved hypothetical protein [Oleispira antarctica RB-8]
MSKTVSVPAYLADDYQMLTENIESYQDPEDPDAFKNYVDSLLGQLNKTPGFLDGMPDQLAICLLYVVKVNSAKLLPLCSDYEPQWEDVKTCVNVHKNFRDLVSTLSNEYQEQLKTALLLLCFYDLGAAEEEFHADVDESEEQDDDEYQQDSNDY